MEIAAHDRNERLNRLIRLFGCSLLRGLRRLAPEESAAVLTEACRMAAATLKAEGVVFARPTPVETINAVLSYFVENGYFRSASAELLGAKNDEGFEIVRIREVPSAEHAAVCPDAETEATEPGRCFCFMMMKREIASAFGEDFRVLESYGGQNGEKIVEAALAPGIEPFGSAEAGRDEARAGKMAWGFRRAIAMSLDAIISTDEGGAIILWNPAAERVFGYSEEEMMGRNIALVIPKEYLDQHMRGLERFVSTGQGRLIGKVSEVEGLRKDGSKFPLELSLSAEREEGRWMFTGVVRDISSRKKLEDELRQRLIEMERINKIMVGRELRMQELRDEIKALRAEKNEKKTGTS